MQTDYSPSEQLKLSLGSPITFDQPIYLSDPTYLGAGGFGEVYKVKVKNPELNKFDWVVKKLKSSVFPEECKIQSRYYYTFKQRPFSHGYNWIVSEFIPGQSLSSMYRNQVLSFVQGLWITCELAEQLNQYHNYTRMGNPIVHGDVKPENIKIEIKENHSIKNKNMRINARLYDFGCSSEHATDDPNQVFSFYHTKYFSVNSAYFPIEAVNGLYGYKSDIYMFANTIKKVFAHPPHSMDGVLPLVNAFLNSMKNQDYYKRPNSEETLKFFLTVNKFYLLNEEETKDPELEKSLIAKLIIIAAGLWQDKMNDSDNDDSLSTTWRTFDFEDSAEISTIICDLASECQFNLNRIKALLTNVGIPAIKHLMALDLANENNLIMLSNKPELGKQLISADKDEVQALLYENASEFLSMLRLNESLAEQQSNNKFRLKFKTIETLLQKEANRMSLPQVAKMALILINQNIDLNLDFLSLLQGSLKEKRLLAKKIISCKLQKLDSVDAVKCELSKLKKVNYLHDRQGFFKFSIFHNYKDDEGKKVSTTWMELEKMHQGRIALLENTKELFSQVLPIRK